MWGGATQYHPGDQHRPPREVCEGGDPRGERSPAVQEEGTHQEPEVREGVCPWRGRGLPGRQAGPEDARVPLRRPDQEPDGRGGSEEMPDGRTIGREQDVDEKRRPREQSDSCVVAATIGQGLDAYP